MKGKFAESARFKGMIEEAPPLLAKADEFREQAGRTKDKKEAKALNDKADMYKREAEKLQREGEEGMAPSARSCWDIPKALRCDFITS